MSSLGCSQCHDMVHQVQGSDVSNRLMGFSFPQFVLKPPGAPVDSFGKSMKRDVVEAILRLRCFRYGGEYSVLVGVSYTIDECRQEPLSIVGGIIRVVS